MAFRGVFCFILFTTALPEHRATRRATADPRWCRGPRGGLHARTEHARPLLSGAPGPARGEGKGRQKGPRGGGARGPGSWQPAAPGRGGGEMLPRLPGYDPWSHWSFLKKRKFKDQIRIARWPRSQPCPGSSFCGSTSFLPELGSACTGPHLSFFLLPSPRQPITTKLLEISTGSHQERCEVGENAPSAFHLITRRNSLQLLFILFLEPISRNLSFRCNLKRQKTNNYGTVY